MADTQMQDIINQLTETNQRIWDEWTKALQLHEASSDGNPVNQLYQQNLDFIEKLIKETLVAESHWVDEWHQALAQQADLPDPVNDMLGSMRATVQTMLDNRSKLWESWLDQARRMNFDGMPNVVMGGDTQNTLMQVWDEFMQHTGNLQSAMFGPAPTPSTGKKAAPAPAPAPKPAAAKPAPSKPTAAPAPANKPAAKPAPAAKKPAAKKPATAGVSKKAAPAAKKPATKPAATAKAAPAKKAGTSAAKKTAAAKKPAARTTKKS